MKWFTESFSTLDELKNIYRNLCRKLHPDMGGRTEEFQEMSNEFEKILSNWHYYEKQERDTEEQAHEFSESLRDIIAKVIRLHGNFRIEIIGHWVWITGETFLLAQQLKELAFAWSKAKKAWYWSGEEWHKRRGFYSLDALRGRFGSINIENMSESNISKA